MANVACVIEPDITDAEEVSLLERVNGGAEAWNAWRQENPSVRIDLSGIDLSNCDLVGVNFEGCDLSGADLFGSHMSGALLDRHLHHARIRRHHADALGASDHRDR